MAVQNTPHLIKSLVYVLTNSKIARNAKSCNCVSEEQSRFELDATCSCTYSAMAIVAIHIAMEHISHRQLISLMHRAYHRKAITKANHHFVVGQYFSRQIINHVHDNQGSRAISEIE